MERKSNCPKCKSSNIDYVKYLKEYYLICDNCGYDASSKYQLLAEEKTSQKAKGNYSPYRSRTT
ncbi:hypothetical protein HZA96_02670 [Candidatus Woesearchaeota archaeon]|nr:hypothetical protein [Candidatus Woesearchaeota archaeon]